MIFWMNLNKYQEFMALSKNPLISEQYRQLMQWILALKGLTPVRHDLSGNGLNLSEHIGKIRRKATIFGLCLCAFPQDGLTVFVQEIRRGAVRRRQELDKHIKVSMGTILVADHYFIYSLILIALLREGDTAPAKEIQVHYPPQPAQAREMGRALPGKFPAYA